MFDKSNLVNCVKIFVCMGTILLFCGFFNETIIASLGATCFILIATPKKQSARGKNVFGGYLCGFISGELCNFCYIKLSSMNLVTAEHLTIIAAAAAVMLASLLMMAFDLKHPPAAAFALSITTEARSITVAVLTLFCLIILFSLAIISGNRLQNPKADE